MEQIKTYIDDISNIVEAIGVAVIFFGILYAIFIFLINKTMSNRYILLRQNLGKSILLGLEILIAADIMATVITDPTLQSVTVLAVIVLIRTIMSLSLEVELYGKFPWQKNGKTK